MSKESKYKQPSQEELDLMRRFSEICGKGMEIILACDNNPALINASTRMQESMMWFHSYVVNGGKMSKEGSSH